MLIAKPIFVFKLLLTMDNKVLNTNNISLFLLFFLFAILTTINKVELDRILNFSASKTEVLTSPSKLPFEQKLVPDIPVKIIPLKTELIELYAGTYHFKSKDKNYTIVLQPNGNQLEILDRQENEIYTIRATSDTTFIDISRESTFVMRTEKKGKLSLIWNNEYEFKKE